MSKIIDITDKLSFEGNPKLIIRGVEIEVNTDAPTVLKFMKLIDDGGNSEASTVIKAYELLFSDENRTKIDELKLGFEDLIVVIKTAMSFINDSGDTEGEN